MSMSKENLVDVEVENGKYRYVLSSEGKAKCYRYGEEWRDVVGDKFILCLAQRIQELEEQLDNVSGGYPDCDTCGGSMNYMPWHYATETERHLHACDECWPKINPTQPPREQEDSGHE